VQTSNWPLQTKLITTSGRLHAKRPHRRKTSSSRTKGPQSRNWDLKNSNTEFKRAQCRNWPFKKKTIATGGRAANYTRNARMVARHHHRARAAEIPQLGFKKLQYRIQTGAKP
jgi:hypothetical protein